MNEPLPLQTVRELKALENGQGRMFASLLVIRRLTNKTSANGNPYLSLELGDRDGCFSCTMFSDSPLFDALRTAGEGAVVRIEGRIDYFQSRFSPRLTKVEVQTDAQLQDPGLIERLVECAPEDSSLLWRDFEGFIAGIGHDELRMTVRGVFEELGDSFRNSPAAISMHHAYRHGLLEHTVHMARVCRALLPLYPEVDPDLAMAGILLHDVGKTVEYEGGLAIRRSRKGILQGHVVLGYQMARKAALRAKLDPDRTERLEHIILSHQGELEWGAAVHAATPEAIFVAKIDDLDAKMGMAQRVLRQCTPGEEFSERHPGLNTNLLLKKLPGKEVSGER